MNKLSIALIALAVSCLPLAAQIDLPKPDFSLMPRSGRSFLDTNKLSMSHSLGFEAGSSSFGGYYLSRYTNHLKYSFNPKLDLQLDLSLINFGSSSPSFKINDDNSSRFVPGFTLDYHPSESFKLQVKYQQGYPMWGSIKPWYEQEHP